MQTSFNLALIIIVFAVAEAEVEVVIRENMVYQTESDEVGQQLACLVSWNSA